MHLYLLLSLLALAPLQDPPKPKPIELPPVGVGGDSRREMIELFHKVEKRLDEIDKLLYDASADGKAQAQAESGMSDLLKRSIDKSQQVTRDIDRILELAAQNGGTCRSAMSDGQSAQPGSSQPKQGQRSPLDRQGERASARENTPEKPAGEKEQPQPGGQQPQPANDSQGQPRNPFDAQGDSRTNRAGPPPSQATARTDAAQHTERWGDLPEHVRDLFRTEGGGDMPVQYRDWIDAYYRRLNQRP